MQTRPDLSLGAEAWPAFADWPNWCKATFCFVLAPLLAYGVLFGTACLFGFRTVPVFDPSSITVFWVGGTIANMVGWKWERRMLITGAAFGLFWSALWVGVAVILEHRVKWSQFELAVLLTTFGVASAQTMRFLATRTGWWTAYSPRLS